MTLSIIRANNPCALRPHPGEGWLGNNGVVTTIGGDYQSFTSMAWGIRAALRNLHTYRTKHGLHTPRGIINRWAPPHDNNPTSAYAANVARGCGVGIDEPIPFDYLGTWKLLTAIIRQETGGATIHGADIAAAFRIMAKEEARRGSRGVPQVYTPPLTIAPMQRTRQEAEKVGRRGWATIAALITGAFTQARDVLLSVGIDPSSAIAQIRALIPALPPLAWLAIGLVALVLFDFLFNRRNDHERSIPHSTADGGPDAPQGRTGPVYRVGRVRDHADGGDDYDPHEHTGGNGVSIESRAARAIRLFG